MLNILPKPERVYLHTNHTFMVYTVYILQYTFRSKAPPMIYAVYIPSGRVQNISYEPWPVWCIQRIYGPQPRSQVVYSLYTPTSHGLYILHTRAEDVHWELASMLAVASCNHSLMNGRAQLHPLHCAFVDIEHVLCTHFVSQLLYFGVLWTHFNRGHG